jgi:hypothetical protein
MSNSLLANGADGISEIEGKAVTGSGDASEFQWSRGDASDIDGQAKRPNGALGESDIEHVAIGNGAEGSAT